MKFATASEHRQFFRKNQLIEFENILNEDQIFRLIQEIDSALSQRLGINPHKLKETPSEKLFSEGRDLWRANYSLKKGILQSSLAEIASELVEDKPIRIGFDQFFPKKFSATCNKTKVHEPFHSAHSLNEMSCLKGIVCGLMLCLSHTSEIKEKLPLSIFPSQAGNGVFFHPDLALHFLPPPELQENSYLLIAYCKEMAIYYLQENDLHTHALKRLGYVFGDKLSNAHHPIIYR